MGYPIAPRKEGFTSMKDLSEYLDPSNPHVARTWLYNIRKNSPQGIEFECTGEGGNKVYYLADGYRETVKSLYGQRQIRSSGFKRKKPDWEQLRQVFLGGLTAEVGEAVYGSVEKRLELFESKLYENFEKRFERLEKNIERKMQKEVSQKIKEMVAKQKKGRRGKPAKINYVQIISAAKKEIQKEFDEYRAEQSGKRQVYTIEEFAEEVGLSYGQVLKRINKGEIKAGRAGKKYQIPREEKFKYRERLEEERLKELSGIYRELANTRKGIERLNNKIVKYRDLEARLPDNIVTEKELNKYMKGYEKLIKENIQNGLLNMRDEFSKATGELMLEEYNRIQFPTVKEAARELKLEPKELYRMLRTGLITPIHIGKGVHLTRKQVDVIKLFGPEKGVYEGMEMVEQLNRELSGLKVKYNLMEAVKSRMEEKMGILENQLIKLRGNVADLGEGKGKTSPEEKALTLPREREYFEGGMERLRGNLYQWAAKELDFVLQMAGEDDGKEIEDSLLYMAGPPGIIDNFCERLKGLANAYKVLHNFDEGKVKDLTRAYSKLPHLGKGAYKPLDWLATVNENNVIQNEEFTIGMIKEWDQELAEMGSE